MLIDLPNADATRRLGQRLAECLFPGAILALIGPLGAGKTFLTRAVVEGLGGTGRHVASPTFTLIHEYPANLPVYHFDAYRLPSETDFFDLGVHEFFESTGVCLIEWADRVPGCLPTDHLRVKLMITGTTSRQGLLEAFGDRYRALLEHLARQQDNTLQLGEMSSKLTKPPAGEPAGGWGTH